MTSKQVVPCNAKLVQGVIGLKAILVLHIHVPHLIIAIAAVILLTIAILAAIEHPGAVAVEGVNKNIDHLKKSMELPHKFILQKRLIKK
jgi:quinol-cytochrome oxidoreductase complex cytochrome b subunit